MIEKALEIAMKEPFSNMVEVRLPHVMQKKPYYEPIISGLRNLKKIDLVSLHIENMNCIKFDLCKKQRIDNTYFYNTYILRGEYEIVSGEFHVYSGPDYCVRRMKKCRLVFTGETDLSTLYPAEDNQVNYYVIKKFEIEKIIPLE